MAKYKTAEEAVADLTRQLNAKQTQLKAAQTSGDRVVNSKTKEIQDEITKLERQIKVEELSAKGPLGKLGVAGVGLLTGLPKGVTSMIDLAAMAGNKLEEVFPSAYGQYMRKDYLLTPKVAPGVEATAAETTPSFGLGEGAGMAAIGGPRQMLFGGLTRAADETFFNGKPVSQIGLLLAQLAQAGGGAIRNWQTARGVKNLEEQLGPEDFNLLKEFTVRGQSSSDPKVAGMVARLRSDPRFSEIFNVFERAAGDKALAGTRVVTKPGYSPETAGTAIAETVGNKILGLKENIGIAGGGAYKKAFEIAGDDAIVATNNTQKQISDLIAKYKISDLPDSKNTVKFLEGLQESLTNGVFEKKITPKQLQAWLTDYGKKAAGNESLITDISVGTQKQIASSIFGGLKDDLSSLAKSNNTTERAVGNLLKSGSSEMRKAVDVYQGAIAQGLPAYLQGKSLASIDTDELMKVVGGLSAKQQKDLFTVLTDTAPEDLKRIQQVSYDNFVQSARTTLPDGLPGVDLKTLAEKFNKLPEPEKNKLALALGTTMEDFSGRMKEATDFFRYQQKYARPEATGNINPATASEITYAGTGGAYAPSKVAGAATRVFNELKSGLSDEKIMSLLIRPEGKNLLKNTQISPNSQKTLEQIDKVFVPSTPAQPLIESALTGSRVEAPTEQPAQEWWDIQPGEQKTEIPNIPSTMPSTVVTPQQTQPTKEWWDVE